MKDYYYILGVEKFCPSEDIKSAYRKLSKKFHPDKNEGDKFFEERFKDIQEAYEILSNQQKRDNYDFELQEFNSAKTNTQNQNENTEQTYQPETEVEEEIKSYSFTPLNKQEKKSDETSEIVYKSWSAIKSAVRWGLLGIIIGFFVGIFIGIGKGVGWGMFLGIVIGGLIGYLTEENK